MKMIKLYFPIVALAFVFSTSAASAQVSANAKKPQTTQAQTKPAASRPTSQLPSETAEHPALRNLTLSGIDLFPNHKQGTFQLRFTQQLKFETDTDGAATLLLTDAAGNVIYSDIFNPEVNVPGRPIDVGKLHNGIYLIEVKTNETTFWKKVKVQNRETATKIKTKRRS